MHSTRMEMALIALPLLAYSLAFFVFYPRAITVTDEACYVRQAAAFARGEVRVSETDPITGMTQRESVGYFAPGTSALMAPFVAVFGWRGAYVVPWLATIAAVLLTALLLLQEGRHPLFALVVMGYPALAVLGRNGMSDVPSAAFVAAGLLFLWLGERKSQAWWGAAGFAAGLSPSLRETNILLFVPLFTGACFRSPRRAGVLVAGGIAGLMAWAALNWVTYGVLVQRTTGFLGFSMSSIAMNLPLQITALTVLVPGGLVSAALYRGNRRPEVITTIFAFFLLYLAWWYRGAESGGMKGLILGTRFYIPLLPFLALTLAEVLPRKWGRLMARFPDRVAVVLRAAAILTVIAWGAAVMAMAIAVHWKMDGWTASQAAIRDAIYSNTPDGAAILTNDRATAKFINELYGERLVANLPMLSDADVARVVRRYGSAYIVLLYRTDSGFWRDLAVEYDERIEALERSYDVSAVFRQDFTSTDQLAVWELKVRQSAAGE